MIPSCRSYIVNFSSEIQVFHWRHPVLDKKSSHWDWSPSTFLSLAVIHVVVVLHLCCRVGDCCIKARKNTFCLFSLSLASYRSPKTQSEPHIQPTQYRWSLLNETPPFIWNYSYKTYSKLCLMYLHPINSAAFSGPDTQEVI